MFKSSPRRNPRSKAARVKYAVQIFLLLGASLWLLYQLKHSRDQKPTLSEASSVSQQASSGVGISSFGRKGLDPLAGDEERPEDEDSGKRKAGNDQSENSEDLSEDFENLEQHDRDLVLEEGIQDPGDSSPEDSVPGNTTSGNVRKEDEGNEAQASAPQQEKNGKETELGFTEALNLTGNGTVSFADASGAGSMGVGHSEVQAPTVTGNVTVGTTDDIERVFEKEEDRSGGEEGMGGLGGHEEAEVMASRSWMKGTVMETRTDLGTLPETTAGTNDIETTAAE